MSLLDDVSIVVTPNGYKAGELYAVIPVPTEGAEKILNTDFATDSNWTPLGDWAISGGSANCNGGSIMYTNASIIATKIYKITYTVSGFVSGGVKVRINASPDVDGLVRTSNGTFTEYITSSSSPNGNFSFAAASSFVGSIDNVSVKEYTSADMDVTRATAATRVDENGLVNYALGVEEVTNGDFSNGSTDWTPYGSTFVVSNANPYNGNDTALFTGLGVGGAKVTQSISTVVGNTYHLSCYAQYNSGDQTNVEIEGVLEYPNGLAITSHFTTFTFLQTSFTATSTTSVVTIRERGGNNNASCYLYGLSVKEVNNVPRIDYTGGGCPHILSEPMRTNLITYSEDFSQWSKEATVTLTPNYSTSPDGTNNATRVQLDADDSMWLSSLGSSKAFSIYVKGVAGETIRISNGVATMFTLTGNWDRLEVFDTSGSSTLITLNTYSSATARDIQIWGAQLEESYATSYIPTSGSTVTRNQDIFTRDGIGSLINSTEGVLFAEIAALANDGTNRAISISDGTTSNVVRFYYSVTDNRIVGNVKSGGSSVFNYNNALSDATDFIKVAVSYKADDYKMYVNGIKVSTDTSGAVPIGLTELSFDNGAGNDKLFGKVKQLQVYDTALTDEQLLQLTGESGTDFYESYAEMAAALTYTIQ